MTLFTYFYPNYEIHIRIIPAQLITETLNPSNNDFIKDIRNAVAFTDTIVKKNDSMAK